MAFIRARGHACASSHVSSFHAAATHPHIKISHALQLQTWLHSDSKTVQHAQRAASGETRACVEHFSPIRGSRRETASSGHDGCSQSSQVKSTILARSRNFVLFCICQLSFMHAGVRLCVLCEVAGNRVHSTKCKPAANLPREKVQAILECPSEAAMTPTAPQFQA